MIAREQKEAKFVLATRMPIVSHSANVVVVVAKQLAMEERKREK